jgi:hypothetical protein
MIEMQRYAAFQVLLILLGLFVVLVVELFLVGVTAISYSAVIVALLFAGIFWFIYQATPLLPKSYHVAVVGYPLAGKSTMIASFYDEGFARRLNATLRPRGASTIDTVDSMLRKVKSGHAIGPTSDQERFGFRADITWHKYGIPRVYEVEFGDFPGRDSEAYASVKEPWLHKTEFFKWVVDSDAMVMTIDSGHYLLDGNEYVVLISGALRSFWQHFLDANRDRESQTRRHPLALVITKIDLFAEFAAFPPIPITDASLRDTIQDLAFGTYVPPFREMDALLISEVESHIAHDFAELIDYFKHESSDFRLVLLSSYGRVKEYRIGFNDFLAAVMPK